MMNRWTEFSSQYPWLGYALGIALLRGLQARVLPLNYSRLTTKDKRNLRPKATRTVSNQSDPGIPYRAQVFRLSAFIGWWRGDDPEGEAVLQHPEEKTN